MEQQVQELKNQQKELLRDKEMLMQKGAALNAKYTLLETGYDENMASLRSEHLTLKNKLLAQDNVKEDFQQQVNIISYCS